MAIKKEPLVSRVSSITPRKKSLNNWNIWLFCVGFSMLFLLVVPAYRFFRFENYTTLSVFTDVFGNLGMCTITASMAIAAAFEARIRINNWDWAGLVLIAVACYIVHGAIAHEPAVQSTSLLEKRIMGVNILLFSAMFILSLRSFGLLSFKSLPNLKLFKFNGKR